MAIEMRLKIPKARPVESLIQVDLRDHHRSPFLRLRQGAPILVPNCADHPIARDVFIGAANEVDVVFTSPRGGKGRVATPYWPSNYLGAPVA